MMSGMFDVTANLFFTTAAAATTAFLGLLVFIHNHRNASYVIFTVHAAVGALWSVATYFSVTVPAAEALFWIRLVLFFAVPHVFLFLLFVQNFPEAVVRGKVRFFLEIALMLALMALVFTPHVFSGVAVREGNIVPVPGALMPIFSPLLVIFFVISVISVFRKFFQTSGEARHQWFAIGSGLIVSYAALISLVFLRVIAFSDTTFVPYSPLFLLPIFLGSSYAIFRYRLFNIKVVATESLVLTLLLASLFEIIVASSTFGFILGIIITTAILFLGILLIRSVEKEIEQRKRLEKLTRELQSANEHLQKLDKLRSEFLSFASHQVKSPMAVVKGYASLIADGSYGAVPEEVGAVAEKIKKSADRLIGFVDNLLNMRRIEEGRVAYDMKERDIVPIVRGVFDEFSELAREKGLDVRFSSELPSVRASVDEEKFRQVVQNLIDNAVKYTREGFVEVCIRKDGGNALISVKDSGIGISPELLPRLFSQFARDPKAEKQIQGTGLGLYIAREIARAHGGDVWAESAGEGKGSTFFIRIPFSNM